MSNNITETLPSTKECKPLSKSTMTQPESQQRLSVSDKARLSSMVTLCFQGLNNYGKEPEALPYMMGLFEMVLDKYPIDKIEEAFKVYLAKNSIIPTPSDILMIISRANKSLLNRDIYQAYSNIKIENRSWLQKRYREDYESFYTSQEMQNNV